MGDAIVHDRVHTVREHGGAQLDLRDELSELGRRGEAERRPRGGERVQVLRLRGLQRRHSRLVYCVRHFESHLLHTVQCKLNTTTTTKHNNYLFYIY